jgi:hypothetical protein
MESAVAVAALAAIGLFTIVTWTFVIRYLRKPWRSTREGRTLMFMKICLALIGTIIFVFRFILNGPEYFDFRAGIYTVLFLTMTWQMIMFNKYLMEKDNSNERGNSDSTTPESDSVL